MAESQGATGGPRGSITFKGYGGYKMKHDLGATSKRALLMGCAVSVLASAAHAQTAPASSTVDELVVTAERRAQSIQTVPIAITAVTAAGIEKSNIRGIEDYVAKTPNVSFVSNGSRDRKEISIRGVSNQLDPASDVRPASYAFYIDEFSVSAGTSNPDVLDVERIEMLRGPQGTYFGRNSIGGAINITTKRPTNELGGEINLGYSSYDTRRVSGVVNLPIVNDIFAVRLAAQSETSDGNIKNINPIGGGNDSNYRTFRAVARYTPNDRFTWDNTYSISRERNGMRAGVPTGVLTQTWRTVHYGGRPGNIADPDGVGFYPANRDKVNFNRPQSVGTDFWYASSRATYDFDNFTLTAVGGYLKTSIFNKGDVDGSSLDLYYEDNYTHRDSASGELRLQSTTDSKLEWSAGLSVGRDTGSIDQTTFYGTQNKQNQAPGGRITRLVTDATDTYQAVFGQLTYHATDELTLVVGGRYSHERVERDILRASNEVILDLVVDRAKSFSDFSPRITVNYQPIDHLLLYATASKGFKSGGVQSAQLSLKSSYDSETVMNYELGLKTDFLDRRLMVDVAAFYLDWKNVQQAVRFQYLDSNNVLRNVTGIDNAASAESYGIDGSATFRVNDRLTLGAHAGWLEAHYNTYKNALIDGILIDASGKRMIAAPKWTLGAEVEYRQPVFGDFEGFVRGEWNYRSEILSSFLALRYENFPFISPEYHNVNLRMGVENDKMRLSIFAENAFDENYYSNAYEKAFYSGVQVEPAFRRIGVNLRYRFD